MILILNILYYFKSTYLLLYFLFEIFQYWLLFGLNYENNISKNLLFTILTSNPFLCYICLFNNPKLKTRNFLSESI